MHASSGIRAAVTFGAIMALGGCGDGGGGMVASVSAPPPPVVSNASLASLTASQSFSNNAASATATIAASANVTAAASTSQPMTFSYDLASNSYTVSTQGRSQTFAPASQASAKGGIAVYAVTNGATADRLTIETASVTGYAATSPQYSGLGYWQRTVSGSGSSDVSVDFFIYGLPSAISAVPRTGSAAYATSVYGLVSPLGTEARFFQGTGRMDVDFADALLTTSATVSESGIVSQANYGTGATLTGSGTLSSSANAFTGSAVYTGLNSASHGTLAGQFYGPGAQEVGASFTTTAADGSSATGVIWGNQNSTLPPINPDRGQPRHQRDIQCAIRTDDTRPERQSRFRHRHRRSDHHRHHHSDPCRIPRCDACGQRHGGGHQCQFYRLQHGGCRRHDRGEPLQGGQRQHRACADLYVVRIVAGSDGRGQQRRGGVVVCLWPGHRARSDPGAYRGRRTTPALPMAPPTTARRTRAQRSMAMRRLRSISTSRAIPAAWA